MKPEGVASYDGLGRVWHGALKESEERLRVLREKFRMIRAARRHHEQIVGLLLGPAGQRDERARARRIEGLLA